MFLGSKARVAAASLAAGAAILIHGAAFAAIVVASSGPSASQYPAGKKIPDNTRITLKAGDSITVLDGGSTRVLRGAGTVVVGQRSGASSSSAFAALTRQRSSSRVRTGAVRGSESASVLSPNLWYVDASKPGTVCVIDTQNVNVWRPDTTAAQTLRVTPAKSGGQAKVAFAPGSMIAPWDTTAAPIGDGSSYRVEAADGSQPRQFTFAVLPAQPDDAEETAALLIERGCSVQLELLSASLGPAAG